MTNTAIVIGVGPMNGLGAQLCLRFAKEGLHVIAAGRTPDNLDGVVAAIRDVGGSAEAYPADATNETAVQALVDQAGSKLQLAIYNAGNNTPGRIVDMDADYFEKSWRIGCFGGFLFARAATRRMLEIGQGGTVLFTGASASLRGRANFGAFNSSKAGLRTLAQAMAKEYAKDGIHIGHVVVDGPIGGDKILNNYPEYAEQLGEQGMISIDGIVDGYVYLYRQPPRAWTFELDVRTSQEQW